MTVRWLTVTEATARVNRSNEETVRRWIRAGNLRTVRLRGRYYIEEGSLLDAERDARRNQRGTRFTSSQASTACGTVPSQ